MRKSSVEVTFASFDRAMDHAEFVLLDLLGEVQDDELRDRTVRETVVGALALLFASEWEWLVRTLMVDLLNRNTSRYREFTSFAVRRNLRRGECEALLHGIGYLDFRNIEDLRGRARQVLVPANNPFEAIRPESAALISDFLVLRNYIAHQSKVARRAVKRVMEHNGLRRVVSPASFLLSRGRVLVYSAAFWDAEEAMREFLALPPRSKGEDFYTFYQVSEPEAVVATPASEAPPGEVLGLFDA